MIGDDVITPFVTSDVEVWGWWETNQRSLVVPTGRIRRIRSNSFWINLSIKWLIDHVVVHYNRAERSPTRRQREAGMTSERAYEELPVQIIKQEETVSRFISKSPFNSTIIVAKNERWPW
jgi:hypothetical protein